MAKKEATEIKKEDPRATWLSSKDRKNVVESVEMLIERAYDKQETVDKVLKMLDKFAFYDSPASSTHHYNFFGGLAKHSLHVVTILTDLCENYPDFNVEYKSVIRAGLFHDICKCEIYVPNINKDGSLSKKPFKVEDSYPIGVHGDKSIYRLEEERIPLTYVEKLMIRHHMGKFDSMSPDFDKIKKSFPQIGIMSIADQLATQIEDMESKESPDEE